MFIKYMLCYCGFSVSMGHFLTFYFFKVIIKYHFLHNIYCRINFLTNAFGPSMRKVVAVDD